MQQFYRVAGIQLFGPLFNLNMRVQRGERRGSRLHLGLSERSRVKGDLPLEVRQSDAIIVDQPQSPDPRCSQVKRCRRTYAAEPHQPDAGGPQPLLPRPADFGQNQMTRVALYLVVREGHLP